MLSRWKTALGQTLMGTPVSCSQSSEPSSSPSANFDRAMPQVQQLETPLFSTHSINPPLPCGASAANNFIAAGDQREDLQTNDDGNQGVDTALTQHVSANQVDAQTRQSLGNVLLPPDQRGQPLTPLAQNYNIVTRERLNQGRIAVVEAASGSKQVVQGPRLDIPTVMSRSDNSIPGPIAILHQLEDGSTFSFAIGTKYRGRRAFQLPADRIFFDNGWRFKQHQFHTSYFPKPPLPAVYPITGFWELRCSHNSKEFGDLSCPCYIKLRYQLHQMQVPIDEVEFEMVEFVNKHAFHLGDQRLPRTYQPSKIQQEYITVTIRRPTRTKPKGNKNNNKNNNNSDFAAAVPINYPKDSFCEPSRIRVNSMSSYPSKASTGSHVPHLLASNLFPCSTASLEKIRLQLRGEAGANVGPNGGSTATRTRWVCHVRRGTRSHCGWQAIFTSTRNVDEWHLCETESHMYHNHSIPGSERPILPLSKPLNNSALGVVSLDPTFNGRTLPPLQPLGVPRELAQAEIDEKPSEQLRIEASHRYQERNAPSPEAIVRPAPPVPYESQQSIDPRSSSKHVRSESFEGGDDASPFKSPRYTSLAPTPIERNASLDFDPYAYLHDDYRETQPIPRMETDQGSSSIDSLETFLYNLAPNFTFRLLETRTQHNLTLLAPSFAALDYTHPESIQDLELRDLDDLMIELRQHFDQHQKGDSGGIGLHDWKRIANRLQAALKS
ncbi:hypothetical protein JCM5353_003725 [Sporobolomyces roseus]